ncbi:Non-motile and phage-resistance protein [uncultured Clostridium sp.]|uniref:ligand-binding sensor domain-containing protein n=1 Tax=uncultured Clostridium sp. TaxID=59620 RepID=UPI000822A056|nr:sensor histidine kinase [uncultured Clostridium sp.]SCI72056.1 Non-motile and phage-resistance protein [uncultured Clostridium sp.]
MSNKCRRIARVLLLITIILVFRDKIIYAVVNDSNRNFKRITTEDGLSQGSISSIIQDSRGYMWIGTGDGLNKYNGNKFEIYKYSGKEKSISGNSITDIKEDDEGNIWVGTTTGLSKINPITDEVTNYLPNEDGCNISHYRIRKILISKSGDILIGTNDGLNIYDKENDNFIRIYSPSDKDNSLSNQEVYSLEEDINGNFWVGTRNGLNKINNKTKEIKKYFANDKDEKSISHNFIYSLHADELGYLWIGTYYGGLNKLNLKTEDIEKYMPRFEDGIAGGYIRDVLRDSRGDVWIATDYGFAKFIEEENRFIRYKSSKYNLGSLISDDTKAICEDKSGAIWIGTSEGISLFNPENLFNYYKSDPFDNNSFSSDMISGIYEDNDGVLWIGTFYDGLNIFDRKNNKITRVDHTEDYEGEFYISNNFVRDITGIDNEIWIATQNGLDKYNKETKEKVQYREENGLPCNDVKTLHIDSKGVLWIGASNGIFSSDRKGSFTNYSQVFKDAGMSVLSFNDIHEDKEGLLWIAGSIEDGLISFNRETKEIKRYNYLAEEEVRKYSYILSINSDNEGNIWIGTDYGIVRFNKETNKYVRYTESDGLPNNFVYGILLDDEGNLWASTNYGITKFDIEEEKFINFNRTDGLQGNEFNQYAYFKSKSGEMFFGGTNGLTSFIPEQIKEKEFITNVQIESILSSCGKVNIEDEINLSYRNNQLEFKFFMPDYRESNKVKYAYRLLGLDEEWTIGEYKNSINYTNLLPGKYEFQVAARNSSGNWSDTTIISIKIDNPPWKTPFAYFSYGTIVIIIIYIMWNRVKILDNMVQQRTVELNNKLVENKMLYSKLLYHEKYKNNYFINLSHELRTPLNIISSTQKVIENLNEEEKQIPKEKMSQYMKSMKRNCTRLINLIDNILYTSKIESGTYKLNIKENDIVYLVEEVALSMKELMDEKGIQLIVEPYIEEKIIECDDLEIERVIINLISNAIKFTDRGGTIEVLLWDLGEQIKIAVKDNGIGIDPKYHKYIFDRFSQEYSETSEEHGGSGLGLTLSKQLIELHNGVIWVESEIGKGSEFIIKLPVKQ